MFFMQSALLAYFMLNHVLVYIVFHKLSTVSVKFLFVTYDNIF